MPKCLFALALLLVLWIFCLINGYLRQVNSLFPFVLFCHSQVETQFWSMGSSISGWLSEPSLQIWFRVQPLRISKSHTHHQGLKDTMHNYWWYVWKMASRIQMSLPYRIEIQQYRAEHMRKGSSSTRDNLETIKVRYIINHKPTYISNPSTATDHPAAIAPAQSSSSVLYSVDISA